MDEMRDLEKRLNEQIDSIAAIEDLGINQISTRNYGFDALLLEADELVKRILSSANRNEDGTLVSKDNIEYNADELAEFFTTNKRIKDTIASMRERFALVDDAKRKMAFPIVSRMNRIKIELKRNDEEIAEKQEKLNSLRQSLRAESLNDELKNYLESEIDFLKKDLDRLGNLNDELNAEYKDLDYFTNLEEEHIDRLYDLEV